MQTSTDTRPPAPVALQPPQDARSPRRYAWFLLLLPCYIAYLVPGIFAREQPAIYGIPFFYWWQFCWIIITALITAAIYMLAVRNRT